MRSSPGEQREGGAEAPRLSYAEEECVVEVAGHVAAAALGLDTSGESIPYVAGWGESGALGTVAQAAREDEGDPAPEPPRIGAGHSSGAA